MLHIQNDSDHSGQREQTHNQTELLKDKEVNMGQESNKGT